MRIYRYTSSDGGVQPRLAVAVGDHLPVDLLGAFEHLSQDPREVENNRWLVSTFRLIEEGPEMWADVERIARAVHDLDLFTVDPARPDVHLLCPLDQAASLRDFLAFEDHVKRGAERRKSEVPAYWYEAPVYYKGNHRALIGPDDECLWPSYTEHLDFELELAMVVGRRGRDLTVEGAGQYIFGFSILNDFSARDIQMREVTAWLGPAKGKDFANAIGPCIVTVDEVTSQPDLEMICRVNGEEWGRSRSSTAKWSWGQMLAHVSASEDVYPGDVYGSGTPGGCCGLDLGRELSPGDVVELEIERIGILRNTIGTPI